MMHILLACYKTHLHIYCMEPLPTHILLFVYSWSFDRDKCTIDNTTHPWKFYDKNTINTKVLVVNLIYILRLRSQSEPHHKYEAVCTTASTSQTDLFICKWRQHSNSFKYDSNCFILYVFQCLIYYKQS